MSKNDAIADNALKIDHTTEDLGLELFSPTGKFGNGLKNTTVERLLLCGEPDYFVLS